MSRAVELQDKGRELEQRIERYLSLNGYTTRRNYFVQGRSGGRHEIDVWAEKSDGITSFTLAVECKAWSHPIEKDIVSKLRYVMEDAGINKGIIVSLAGTRVGAEQSAVQLGIELWGPLELEQKLGQVALADLRAGPAQRLARVIPLIAPMRQAEPIIERQSKGKLGFGREEVVGIHLVWLPMHLLSLNVARTEGGFLKRRATRVSQLWNLYEALSGSLVASSTAPPPLAEESVGLVLPSTVPVSKVVSAIRKAYQKFGEVVTQAARQRYTTQLVELGIPADAVCTVESMEQILYPVYAGMLQRNDRQRVVAVDGHDGMLSSSMTDLLTSRLGYLVDALRVQPTT